MFDQLLGRAALKERIDDLEAEATDLEEKRDRLRKQLDAEQERRADAASDRQAAEEQVNRLQDRITQLEDEVERLRDDEDDGVDFRGVEDLRGSRLDAVLDRLDSVETTSEGAFTAMVTEPSADDVRDAFGERTALVSRATPCLALTDDAGVVSAALRPPAAPDPFADWNDGFELQRKWFRPTGRFAFALVRADLFALGEYRGDEQRSVTGFTSDVKSDHSKGGYSQDRFERRRDEQIQQHVDRCRDELADRNADRLYVVGDENAVERVADDADATGTVGATGDPGDALDDAFREFWTTRLYRL